MSARRVVVTGLAAFVAFAGVEHGIGEVLQGNVAPPGPVFPSWPGSAFFSVVGGEPAMSVVPSLLVSGVLSILVSLVFLLAATVLVRKRHSGLVLIALSFVMLLVGGGFAPPLLGVIAGVAATRLGSPLTWWRTRLSPGPRRILAAAWPTSSVACVLAWLVLFPGLPILGVVTAVDGPVIIPVVSLCALALLATSVFASFAYDAQRAL
jgi:hypothetical protein